MFGRPILYWQYINKFKQNRLRLKKPHSYLNRNKIYKGLFFVWNDFEQKMFKICNLCSFDRLYSVYL